MVDGLHIGSDEEVVVADTNNHRIVVFARDGKFLYMFGEAGREEGQLYYPRKVALLRTQVAHPTSRASVGSRAPWNPEAKYLGCDRGNERSRLQIFRRNGTFISKIAIRYMEIVAGLAVAHTGMLRCLHS